MAAAAARLWWASRHGDVVGVRAALADGASVNWAHPTDGRTPLAQAAALDQLEVLEALLQAGGAAEVAEAAAGLSPLALAVVHGSARCVCRLLDSGVNVDSRDHDGWTPLMHAAACNQLREAQLLLAHGADLEATVSGVTAREMAAVGGHESMLSLIDREAGVRRAKREQAGRTACAASGAPEKCMFGEPTQASPDQAKPRVSDGHPIPLSAPTLAESTTTRNDDTATRPALESAGDGGGTDEAASLSEATDLAQKASAGSLALAHAAASPPIGTETFSFSAARPTSAPTPQKASTSIPANVPAAAASTKSAGARDFKRARCAAPVPGHVAPTRLDVEQEGEELVVRLHSAEILRLCPNGDLVLSSGGGWRTASALSAINQSLTQLLPDDGIQVTDDGGEWMVRDSRFGDVVAFVDGLVIPTVKERPLHHAGGEQPSVAAPPTVAASMVNASPNVSTNGGLFEPQRGEVGWRDAPGIGVVARGVAAPAEAACASLQMAPGMALTGCGVPGTRIGIPNGALCNTGGNPVAFVLQRLQPFPMLLHAIVNTPGLEVALMQYLHAGGMAAAEQVLLTIERAGNRGGIQGAHAALVSLLSGGGRASICASLGMDPGRQRSLGERGAVGSAVGGCRPMPGHHPGAAPVGLQQSVPPDLHRNS